MLAVARYRIFSNIANVLNSIHTHLLEILRYAQEDRGNGVL
jgi:hypothetical protein